jgi:ABC-2 type transport system permease protein
MDTLRSLLAGTPVDDGNAAAAVAWCVVIAAASYVWACRLFDRNRPGTAG